MLKGQPLKCSSVSGHSNPGPDPCIVKCFRHSSPGPGEEGEEDGEEEEEEEEKEAEARKKKQNVHTG